MKTVILSVNGEVVYTTDDNEDGLLNVAAMENHFRVKNILEGQPCKIKIDTRKGGDK